MVRKFEGCGESARNRLTWSKRFLDKKVLTLRQALITISLFIILPNEGGSGLHICERIGENLWTTNFADEHTHRRVRNEYCPDQFHSLLK